MHSTPFTRSGILRLFATGLKPAVCGRLLAGAVVLILAACASKAPPPPELGGATPPLDLPSTLPADDAPLPLAISQPKSQWIPVRWKDLPGFSKDSLHEAWNAWIKSCEKPAPALAYTCESVRHLSIATPEQQRTWLMTYWQPYRIEPLPGQAAPANGLLTGYFEPIIPAMRQPGGAFTIPLYTPPAGLSSGKAWFTRQQIDTQPAVQAQLKGREIAYLNDPIEALVLHIQGSGRLRITEPDGSQRIVRVAYAANNGQPYRSVGSWLLSQRAITDATWPGIRAWVAANPDRINEMLWTNPRYVFFRQEILAGVDASFGPRGAQGVELTPGRSIAVDRLSIPYGTPVWLASPGPTVPLERLVMAQDTGSAILGAVRADFFVGWGPDAGDVAGTLKQDLRLWALWPRGKTPGQ
ncbi:membrane-bound lytic murein transglycosylase A [Comamonas sp. BIGb0124]|nr:membrane-bound lytic murein transglycosylase A [Comamonas sp. BIGb0124]